MSFGLSVVSVILELKLQTICEATILSSYKHLQLQFNTYEMYDSQVDKTQILF